MMQDGFLIRLQPGLSHERLAPYLNERASPREALGLYAWNVALCESLYPCLNSIEIALRNAVHDTVSRDFGNENWFSHYLQGKEKGNVSGVIQKLRKHGQTPTPGRIVSNLLFGFWVKLLSNSYEGILWPRLLKPVFPNMPRRQRTVSILHRRLDRIRRLRNRVFHHEPVWHLTDLTEQHSLILETTGWISPAVLEMTRLLDRFDSVYTMGPQRYTDELDAIAQNWSS